MAFLRVGGCHSVNALDIQEQRAALDVEAKRLELGRERLNVLVQQTQVQEAILEAETSMVAPAIDVLIRRCIAPL